MNQYRNVTFAGLLSLTLLACVYYCIDIPGSSGFNPSDDGMVVAQSYRILNGEIPHKDFMALRTTFSGYLHTLDFFLPFSLFKNGRIIMMLELFIAALAWSFMLLKLRIKIIPAIFIITILFALTIVTFVLNLNTLMPYPWTTTDGTSFAGIGASILLVAIFRKDTVNKISFSFSVIGLWLLSIAPLCKQNFMPLPFIGIAALLLTLRSKKQALFISFMGLFPILAYILYFSWNGAFQELVEQLRGRNSLLGPGGMAYVSAFYKGQLFTVHALVILFTVASYFKQSLLQISDISKKNIHIAITFVYGLAVLIGAFHLFQEREYFAIPYQLFFILLFYTLWCKSTQSISISEAIIALFALAIAWTASISGGMNSPLLGTGYIVSSFVVLSYSSTKQVFQLKQTSTKAKLILSGTASFVALGLLMFSVKGKKEFNYRDKPAPELTKNLGTLLPKTLGGIKTNETTYNYLATIKKVLDENPHMRNRSVFLPNHCAIYPAFETRNPFPLEWNDRWEYLGSEENYHARCHSAKNGGSVYLFIDKINAEVMADYTAKMVYDPWQHENILTFKNESVKEDINNDFFEVYRWE
jgi:hypothetical protein